MYAPSMGTQAYEFLNSTKRPGGRRPALTDNRVGIKSGMPGRHLVSWRQLLVGWHGFSALGRPYFVHTINDAQMIQKVRKYS
jgi:hypothetical protein